MKRILFVLVAFFMFANFAISADNSKQFSLKADKRDGTKEIVNLIKGGINATTKDELPFDNDNIYIPIGSSALMIASYFGYNDIIKYLIDNGADVNIKTEYSYDDIFEYEQTALSFSVEQNNSEAVKMLLDHNAKVLNESMGSTPLVAACYNGNEEIVSMLISNGADVNVSSGEGFAPIFAAILSGNIKVIDLLIEAGVDISAEDFDGRDMFWYAMDSNNKVVIDYLNKKFPRGK